MVLWRHLLGDLQVGPGPGPALLLLPRISRGADGGTSATQHSMPHLLGTAVSRLTARCRIPLACLRSGVRAYLGLRMPNIVYLVTSGKHRLTLPAGVPKGYAVGG